MAKETIQIRIDEETSKFVNRMLRSGLFRTKSDALRYILSAGITAAAKFPEVSEKVERLKSMEKTTGRPPIELSGSLKDLLVNRDRFN
ncbi:MAG: hypothetical protein M1595_01490 [Candidatus Thermoplasmatota archaeon]|jgi:Arc/MetJ-type ribon-helix-helix transcriptional regulator|nr:hypothetical protein [Candidatus Thermoplasmatota archaeon]